MHAASLAAAKCEPLLLLQLGIYVAKGKDGRRAVYAVYILEKKGALPAADFPPMYRQPPLDLLQLSRSSGKWLGSERPAGSGQGPLAQKLAPSRALLEAAHAARRFAPNKQFDSKLGWRLTRVGLDKLVVDLGKALASLEVGGQGMCCTLLLLCPGLPLMLASAAGGARPIITLLPHARTATNSRAQCCSCTWQWLSSVWHG
jgi:hypothetical protein